MRRFALLLLAALVAHGHRLAPRIDSVTPSKLTAGSTPSIEVEGKNLGIDVTLSFGKDVTIIGAPLFTSPTHATMKVTVAAAAKQGGVAVVATNVQTKQTTVVIDSEKLAGSLYARVSGYAGRRVVETSGLVTLLPRGTGEKVPQADEGVASHVQQGNPSPACGTLSPRAGRGGNHIRILITAVSTSLSPGRSRCHAVAFTLPVSCMVPNAVRTWKRSIECSPAWMLPNVK